jgi:hypothetical protein
LHSPNHPAVLSNKENIEYMLTGIICIKAFLKVVTSMHDISRAYQVAPMRGSCVVGNRSATENSYGKINAQRIVCGKGEGQSIGMPMMKLTNGSTDKPKDMVQVSYY